MTPAIHRRLLLTRGLALSAAVCAAKPRPVHAADAPAQGDVAAKPAPARPAWPVWDQSDADGLVAVLDSGQWGRLGGTRVAQFEEALRERMRARFCIATSSGTSALLTALGALNIGPGDEVILPPYTFVATFNAITASFALPVFADSDLQSFQIDAQQVAAAINDRTRLILPVHIGGTPCDLNAIGRVAGEHHIPVIEDACQAPLAEWRGQPVGTLGLGGCFSFQASKNLNSGEGGAVVTNDETFAHQCYNYHTPGNPRPVPSLGRGANFRLTEFQGSLLLTQLARVAAQSKLRDENAAYLSQLISEIPGIQPAAWYEGCTRSAWHLFMFRYDAEQFGGLSREMFLKQLREAGIGASSGYTSLDRSPHVQSLVDNPHYQRIYGSDFMKRWSQANRCPVNDQLCQQAVWLPQHVLLQSRSQMKRIAASMADIRHRATT